MNKENAAPLRATLRGNKAMRKFWEKSLATVLSLGLLWAAVPVQTVQAATEEKTITPEITSTSSFKFETKTLSDIEYSLLNDKDNVLVELEFPGTSKQVQDISTITVPKSTLQAIEKSGRKVTFEIYSGEGSQLEYSWVLTNGKMTTLSDLNLAVKAMATSYVTISDPITVNSMVIQTKYTNEFPKGAQVTIPVNKDSEDDTNNTYRTFYDTDRDLEYAKKNSFYLYRLSGSKLQYETGSKYRLNKDSEFTIPVSKGGSFVLTPTNLGISDPNGNSGSSTDSVQLSASSGTVAVGGTASLLIQKPTSGTFTVTSGNPQAAQVIGTPTSVSGGTEYKIQGLSAGISVFTVTSSNGTKASYTLTVQAKTGWVMIDTLSYNFAPGNIYDYKVTLSGAAASEVQTASSRPHIASVKELRRVTRSDGLVDVYYRITALRASTDPTTVSSTVRGVHSSIRVMVTAGIKQHGVAARNQSFFSS